MKNSNNEQCPFPNFEESAAAFAAKYLQKVDKKNIDRLVERLTIGHKNAAMIYVDISGEIRIGSGTSQKELKRVIKSYATSFVTRIIRGNKKKDKQPVIKTFVQLLGAYESVNEERHHWEEKQRVEQEEVEHQKKLAALNPSRRFINDFFACKNDQQALKMIEELKKNPELIQKVADDQQIKTGFLMRVDRSSFSSANFDKLLVEHCPEVLKNMNEMNLVVGIEPGAVHSLKRLAETGNIQKLTLIGDQIFNPEELLFFKDLKEVNLEGVEYLSHDMADILNKIPTLEKVEFSQSNEYHRIAFKKILPRLCPPKKEANKVEYNGLFVGLGASKIEQSL